MGEQFLFIGGPLDGQRKETRGEPTVYAYEDGGLQNPGRKRDAMEEITIKTVRYKGVRLVGKPWMVYVPEDWKPEKMLERLLAHYRPGVAIELPDGPEGSMSREAQKQYYDHVAETGRFGGVFVMPESRGRSF